MDEISVALFTAHIKLLTIFTAYEASFTETNPLNIVTVKSKKTKFWPARRHSNVLPTLSNFENLSGTIKSKCYQDKAFQNKISISENIYYLLMVDYCHWGKCYLEKSY